MDELLRDKLNELAIKGVDSTFALFDALSEQTPELFDEIILLGVISSAVWAIVPVIFLGLSYTVHRIYKGNDAYWESVNNDLPGWVITAILAVAGTITLTPVLHGVLYPLIAPRMYIMEKIAAILG